MKHSLIRGVAAAWLVLAFSGASAAPPVVAPGQQFTLSENLAAGTVVGTVQASDADGDPIHLFLIGEDEANGNLQPVPFSIEPITRLLRTTAPLNREHQAAWKLRIAATNGSTSIDPQISDVVTVQVQDVGNEPIIGAGDAAFDNGAKFVGSEKVITFAPANTGSQPEQRDVEFYLKLPAGAAFLGTSHEDGWDCGYVPHAVECHRNGIAIGESPPFTVHLLVPSTVGIAQFVTSITAGDYVHVDGRENAFDVVAHAAPADLGLSITPDAASAEVGSSFHYQLDVGEFTNPALPAIGLVKVVIDLDPRWAGVTLAGNACELELPSAARAGRMRTTDAGARWHRALDPPQSRGAARQRDAGGERGGVRRCGSRHRQQHRPCRTAGPPCATVRQPDTFPCRRQPRRHDVRSVVRER